MIIDTYIKTLIENIPKDNIYPNLDLILDGGAFNGGYMMGSIYFLKYLERKKIVTIHRLSCCSVGALIGLSFIYNKLDLASKIANQIIKYIRKSQDLSIFKKKLKKILNVMLENEDISILNNKFYLTYFDLREKRQIIIKKYKNKEDVIEKILKTIYVPYIFDRQMLDESQCMDGVFPYIFEERFPDRKILFIHLQSLSKIKNIIFIKNEQNIFSRLLHGIMDIHDFFQHKYPTDMCSYVDDWSIIDIIKHRMREFLYMFIVYILYLNIQLFNSIPESWRETLIYTRIISMLKSTYNDIMLYVTI